ncbi:MAG: phosphoglycerate kinase [Candidatus Omnitrophica bacterium]|nr:phosphoglycerate kinase [Candidatus Omnitrophota bacterium]
MNKKTIKDLDLVDKKVIVRVDFNVPLDDSGSVNDEARIKAAMPTIQYILNHGASKVILMSHLGRPKGVVVDSLRMDPVAKELARLLGREVEKLDDCVGKKVKDAVEASDKRVILLENLRFHPQETKGDEAFARELASLADIFVNDAFGTAHRAHASTTIIAKFLPACLGFLVDKEIKSLSCALTPEKPYVVILGGAKVSDKITVISNLMERANTLIIGGAMAYTFLRAKGEGTGSSRVEEDKVSLAKEILEKANCLGIKILLPVDHLVVSAIDKPETKRFTEKLIGGDIAVDIGPKTVNYFKQELEGAKTVLWNGPLGIFENPHYCEGTKEIASMLADLESATVIVGGGDSAAAAKEFGVAGKLAHVSTGGGASLEFLEGKTLPAIAAVPNK